MRSRMDVLRDRAKPGRGSMEHQKLKADLGGVEPAPDHPLYPEFVRLTDPKPMGRPVAPEVSRGDRPKAGTPEYNTWWRNNTDQGRAMYERQMARQIAEYHGGEFGSGARRRADQRRAEQAKKFYGIEDQEAANMLAAQYPTGEFPPPLTTSQYEEEGKTRWWPMEQSEYGHEARPVEDVHGVRVSSVEVFQRAAASSWRSSATTTKKPKVRKPEEVWYDVHKHPEGVPGGMGKSPEHHLRGRGWQGHQINEGSGKKTIQYRNTKHPDFVISYGGGSSTKPDHNFRVLYMGTNANIPKVTRSYSVAEAMNKVEELHDLHNGLVVQPMTYGAAIQPPNMIPPSRQKQPGGVIRPAKPRDMTEADAYPDFSEQPEKSRNWWNPEHRYQIHEIPDPPPFRAKETTKTSYVFEIANREDWR
ncbi:MAG TPA: hypothetical protein VIY48_05295 [Candidatus Paceibacterota bacterium]